MAPNKSKPHLAVSTCEENDKSCVEVFQGKSDKSFDHWAFLDQIEAPMWVDLTSEANANLCGNDDVWFHISHPFHQHSSRQLISAFSHSGEVCKNSIFRAEENSSPKLPPSVSKSRGKHYKNMEWAQSSCRLTDKQHPVKKLSSKLSWVNSGSGKEILPRPGHEKSKAHAGSQAGSVCESSLTESSGANFKKNPTCGRSKSNSNSAAFKEVESNSMSTITSESGMHNQQMSLEVSRQVFGPTSGLLSVLKIGVRKSRVLRPASRVELRKSEGSKSASSKSSVGSSSNPGFDSKNLTIRGTGTKEKTPDSRNVLRISKVADNEVKAPRVSKGPTAQNKNIISNSRPGTRTSRSVYQETTKTKVEQQFVRAKVLVSNRINAQDRLVASKGKEKVGVTTYNRSAGAGKENGLGTMAVSQKSKTGETVGRGVLQVQK